MKSTNTLILKIFLPLLAIGLYGCKSDEEKATEYLESAQSYFDKADYRAADIELRNATKHQDSLVAAHYLQSQVAAELKDWQGFQIALQKVVLHDGQHLEANTRLAELYLSLNQLDKAESHLEAASKAGLQLLKYHLMKGTIHAKRNDKENAYAEVSKSLAIDTSSPEAILLHSSLLLSDGLYPPAMEGIERVLAKHPENEPAYHLRSRAHMSKGELKPARADLAKLVALSPNNLQYRLSLAALLARMKNQQEAEQTLRKAVTELPESTPAKLALISHLSQESKEQEALKLLDTYLAAKPEPTLQLAQAELFNKTGQTDKASEVYKSVEQSESTPARLAAQNKLAQIAIRDQRIEDSLSLVDSVLEANPNDPEALLNKGLIQLWKGENNGAIADLSKVLQMAPNSQPALLILARAYLAERDIDQASQQLSTLININPANTEGSTLYAQVLQSQGKTKQAITLLEKHNQVSQPTLQINRLLTRLYLANKQEKQAIVLAKQVSQESGDLNFAVLIESAALQAQGKHAQSNKGLKKLLDNAEYQKEALFKLVFNNRQLGREKESYALLQTIIDNNPENAFAAELLANQYLQAKLYTELDNLISQRLLSNPSWRFGHHTLAQSQLQQKNWQALQQTCQNAIANSTSEADTLKFHMMLASAQLRNDQASDAENTYRKVLEINPGIDDAANNLAFLLSQNSPKGSHRLEEAYNIAARFNSSSKPSYRDTLGWIYYQRGEYKRALGLLESAAKDAPKDASIRYHLGATYAELEMVESAKNTLKQATLLLEKTQQPELAEARSLLESLNGQ
ncbi:tetratricopeptide repeat protein [Porticoccus sp. GXU_MW_L64]